MYYSEELINIINFLLAFTPSAIFCWQADGTGNAERILEFKLNLKTVQVLKCVYSLQESQIKRIFSTMISQKLEVFREEVKPVGEILAQATLNLYFCVSAHFLPTPSKIHYLFNLRDISKVCSHIN